jgi:hypothetical protein
MHSHRNNVILKSRDCAMDVRMQPRQNASLEARVTNFSVIIAVYIVVVEDEFRWWSTCFEVKR